MSYFDEATNAALLRQIAAKLAPSGRFVVDLYNRDYFGRNQGHKLQRINDVMVESEEQRSLGTAEPRGKATD